MRPFLNPDNMPKGRMLEKLALFEAICKARGVSDVTEHDVRAFLAEHASPKLAKRFSPSFLLASSR
jgi:hypothetical protein